MPPEKRPPGEFKEDNEQQRQTKKSKKFRSPPTGRSQLVDLPDTLLAAALGFLSLSDLLMGVAPVSRAFPVSVPAGSLRKTTPIMLAVANRGGGRSWTVEFDWSRKPPWLPNTAYTRALYAVTGLPSREMAVLGSLPRLYVGARFLDLATNVRTGFIPFIRVLANCAVAAGKGELETTIEGLVMPLDMMHSLRSTRSAQETGIANALRVDRENDDFLKQVTSGTLGAVPVLSKALCLCTRMRHFIAVDRDFQGDLQYDANMAAGSLNYTPIIQAWSHRLVELQIWVDPKHPIWDVNTFIQQLIKAEPEHLRHLVLSTCRPDFGTVLLSTSRPDFSTVLLEWEKNQNLFSHTTRRGDLEAQSIDALLNTSFAKQLQTLVLRLPWAITDEVYEACLKHLADGRLRQLRQIGLLGLTQLSADTRFGPAGAWEARHSEYLQTLIVNNAAQLEAFVAPDILCGGASSPVSPQELKTYAPWMNMYRALFAIPTMRRIYGVPLWDPFAFKESTASASIATTHARVRIVLSELMQTVRQEAKIPDNTPPVQFYPEYNTQSNTPFYTSGAARTWETWTAVPAAQWASALRRPLWTVPASGHNEEKDGSLLRCALYSTGCYQKSEFGVIVRSWPWRRAEDDFPVVVWRSGDGERYQALHNKHQQDLLLEKRVAEMLSLRGGGGGGPSIVESGFMWQSEQYEFDEKSIDATQFQIQLTEALRLFRRPVAVFEGGQPTWARQALVPLEFNTIDAEEGLSLCATQRIAKDTLLLVEQGQASILRRRLAAMLLLSKGVWREAVLSHVDKKQQQQQQQGLDAICKGLSQDFFSYFPGQFQLDEWNTALRIASVKLREAKDSEFVFTGPEKEEWTTKSSAKFRYASFPYYISHMHSVEDTSETNVRLSLLELNPGDPAVIAGVFATRDIDAGEELVRTVLPDTNNAEWRRRILATLGQQQQQQMEQVSGNDEPPAPRMEL